MDDYGRLVTLLSIIQLLSLLMDCGARTSLVTFFRPDSERSSRAQVFGSVLLINIGAAVVVSVLSLIFLPHILPSIIHIHVSQPYVALLCLVGYLQSVNQVVVSYYRISNAPRLFAIASISTALSTLLFVLLFLKTFRCGVIGVLSAIGISFGITAASIAVSVFKNLGFRTSSSCATRLLRFGAPLVLANGGELLADTLPVLFLASWAGLHAAGVYGIAMKLSTVTLTLLVLPFTMAYEPYVILNAGSNKINSLISNALSLTLLLFGLLAFAVVVAGPEVIAFMAPPAYRSAQILLFALLPAMAFRTLYYGCEPLLHVKEKSLFKGSSVLICVVTMGCLYPLVVPRWGALGAAIVYMLTVGSYSVFLAVVSFRLWSIFTGGRRFLVSGLLLMAFLAVAYFLPARPVVAHYSYAVIIELVTLYLVTRTGFLTNDESAVLAAAAQRFRSALPGWGD